MKLRVFSDCYLPGAKGGGRVTALANLVASLGDKLDISIVTRNHDAGSDSPYESVGTDKWNQIGHAQVFYARSISILALRRLANDATVDVIYLNSIFSRLSVRICLLRFLGLVRQPVIISPHGELNAGALLTKRGRKWLFLRAAGRGGFYKRALWHATSDEEKRRILASFPNVNARDVFIASDPASLPGLTAGARKKIPGQVTFIFMAPIGPHTNLQEAIKFISRLSGEIGFHIYGPVEDESYWRECSRLLKELPGHVKAEYRGRLEPGDMRAALSEGHFFLFPAWEKNYGYVVIEASSVGCPVICSHPTPWQQAVDAGAAWSIPLANPLDWVAAMQKCVDMDQAGYSQMAMRAQQFTKEESSRTQAKLETLAMFQQTVEHR